jgi:(p)ppGpp synthase/HD superfamily hydrolase
MTPDPKGIYSDRIVEAFRLAHNVHREQFRKGTDVPYIIHPMGVAAIVGANGGDEDQVIAALLHDAVEDGCGLDTLNEIRKIFGDRVADMVMACSDAVSRPKPPWHERKDGFLKSIRFASEEVRLILLADKLYNATAIVTDLRACGDSVWKRFTASRDDTLWYYAELVRALGDGWNHPMLDELRATVDSMHKLAANERL